MAQASTAYPAMVVTAKNAYTLRPSRGGNMSSLPRGPSLAFRVCDRCSGFGFLRQGSFGYMTFPRCSNCKCIGQIYVEDAT